MYRNKPELRRIITDREKPLWARLAALDAFALIVEKEKKEKKAKTKER